MTSAGRVKPKCNRGFTCMILNANGFRASEGVKPIPILFLMKSKSQYHCLYNYLTPNGK